MTILPGCGTFGAPSVDKSAVTISRDCESLARNVEDPDVSKAKDPKLSVGEYTVALGEANDNIDATRECQARQRKRLAKQP